MGSLFILRAAKNQKYAEKMGSWRPLKIISNRYFHENHLEGIIIPNFKFLLLTGGEILQILKCAK